jgi:hypothetical protein
VPRPPNNEWKRVGVGQPTPSEDRDSSRVGDRTGTAITGTSRTGLPVASGSPSLEVGGCGMSGTAGRRGLDDGCAARDARRQRKWFISSRHSRGRVRRMWSNANPTGDHHSRRTRLGGDDDVAYRAVEGDPCLRRYP